jgi:hypothetical protein
MNSAWVGLIFTGFNANPREGTMQYEVMGFRAQDAGIGQPLRRICLQVSVVPVCELLTEDESIRMVSGRKTGGWHGDDALVAIAMQSHKEEVERHDCILKAIDKIKGTQESLQLARIDAWSAHLQKLSGLIQLEIMPLKQHFEDEHWNSKALSELYNERLTDMRTQPPGMVSRDVPDLDASSSASESESGLWEEAAPDDRMQNNVILDLEEISQEADIDNKAASGNEVQPSRIANTPTPPRSAAPHTGASSSSASSSSVPATSPAAATASSSSIPGKQARLQWPSKVDAASPLPSMFECRATARGVGSDSAAAVQTRASIEPPLEEFGEIFEDLDRSLTEACPAHNDLRVSAGHLPHPDTKRGKAKKQQFWWKQCGSKEQANSLAKRYVKGEKFEDLMTVIKGGSAAGKRGPPDDITPDTLLNDLGLAKQPRKC